jgi:hypothetical protein
MYGASTCWKRISPAAGARAVTVREALLLPTEPPELRTVTEKLAPASEKVVAAVVKLLEVAPTITAPSRYHWYWGEGPVALTVNVAASPIGTLWFVGWVDIAGAGIVDVGTDGVPADPPHATRVKDTAPSSAIPELGRPTCSRYPLTISPPKRAIQAL